MLNQFGFKSKTTRCQANRLNGSVLKAEPSIAPKLFNNKEGVMADKKNRYINTSFWDDYYTSDLDPIEKLLFLYFLTNPATHVCGVYQIPLKRVALDTGIDQEMLKKIIGRFEKDDKIFYEIGYVVIKNFVRHQKLNPSVVKGIENGLNDLPTWLKVELFEDNTHRLYMDLDRLFTGSTQAARYIKESKVIEIKVKEIESNGNENKLRRPDNWKP